MYVKEINNESFLNIDEYKQVYLNLNFNLIFKLRYLNKLKSK